MSSDEPSSRARREQLEFPPGVIMPSRFRVAEPSFSPIAGYRDDAFPTKALRIQWRWWSPRWRFLLMFTVFWNLISLPFFFSAIVSSLLHQALFSLIHVAVGLGLGYFVLAKVCNRTELVVDNELRVAHKPIWWPGAVTIPLAQIQRLYCKKYEWVENKTSYSLHARLKDHSNRKLAFGFDTWEEADWLKRCIEARIGLERR